MQSAFGGFMSKIKRIGVLTSGGDAPGMNSVIRAVVRSATNQGIEVMGIYRGYRGLIENDIKPLTTRDVSNIINHGGTILYSDRCLEFKTPEGMAKGVQTCKENGIDGVIAIGGDGTFRGAAALTKNGVPCIGIPGTIDNDIVCTDYTIGFDTAMNTTLAMVDRLRDTCESHARCNVVEVMGRNAGEIALHTGIASGASAIAIPEIPFDEEKMIRHMVECRENGKRHFIVMVSEGLPGYAEYLSKLIPEKINIDTRFCCLGHVVRGGSPSLRDRLLAAKIGNGAVKELVRGNSSIVMCVRDDAIVPMDIQFAMMIDDFYKGAIGTADIETLSEEQKEILYSLIERKKSRMQKLYETAHDISK